MTAMLLERFDFALAEPHAGGFACTLVLPMKPGLMVRFTPRAAQYAIVSSLTFLRWWRGTHGKRWCSTW